MKSGISRAARGQLEPQLYNHSTIWGPHWINGAILEKLHVTGTSVIDVSFLLRVSRRKKRMSSMDDLELMSDQSTIRRAAASECNALMLSHVVHVSPDSRKVHLFVAGTL